MFRITTDRTDDELVMKLEGCLAGEWVAELHTCWLEAKKTLQGRRVRVDLRGICHVDRAGRRLMTVMYRDGAQFVAAGCLMPEVIREIAEMADAHPRGWRN